VATQAAIEAAEVAEVEVEANIIGGPPTTTGGVTRRRLEKYCEVIKRIDLKLRSILRGTREIEAGIHNEVAVKTTKTIKDTKTHISGKKISLKTNQIEARVGVAIAEVTIAMA